MEMRANDHTRSNEDRTLKGLTPNVAGLLCYVAGWISGIVFLVLEQRNRFVRFHALQSIMVFGFLAIAGTVFGRLPVAGPFLAGIIGLTGFILWIILMVKAVNGEFFKMPWVGDIADRLSRDTIIPSPGNAQNISTERPADSNSQSTSTSSADTTPLTAPPASRYSKADEFKERYYNTRARSGRIVASAFAIAWSVILLVFFNFYNQYIAYYEPVHSGGTTNWVMHTLITSDFGLWLPILTATLVLSIIGHAFLIIYDKYIVRQIVEIILDVFSVATVVTLLSIFPFDFSILPNTGAETGASIGLTITLIFLAIGFTIGAIVELIQLIVHLGEGRY